MPNYSPVPEPYTPNMRSSSVWTVYLRFKRTEVAALPRLRHELVGIILLRLSLRINLSSKELRNNEVGECLAHLCNEH